MNKRISVAIGIALAAATYPAQAQFNLDIGKMLDTAKAVVEATTEIDEPKEVELGREWAGVLVGAAPLVNNPGVQQYVNRVGRWLSLHAERPDLEWHFGVLDSPNVNAFATPGGYIFVTRGLVERMRSESELAGVLAHEIAHVVKKHHLKAIQQGAWNRVGGNVASEYLNQRSRSPLASAAGQQLIGGMKEIMLKGLSKEDEYEADRMGVVIAARAGYDPYGLVSVIQLIQAMGGSRPELALLFETHPSPESRLDALSAAMGAKLDPYAQQPSVAARYTKMMAGK
jgi:predicted Zn-dependent protease